MGTGGREPVSAALLPAGLRSRARGAAPQPPRPRAGAGMRLYVRGRTRRSPPPGRCEAKGRTAQSSTLPESLRLGRSLRPPLWLGHMLAAWGRRRLLPFPSAAPPVPPAWPPPQVPAWGAARAGSGSTRSAGGHGGKTRGRRGGHGGRVPGTGRGARGRRSGPGAAPQEPPIPRCHLPPRAVPAPPGRGSCQGTGSGFCAGFVVAGGANAARSGSSARCSQRGWFAGPLLEALSSSRASPPAPAGLPLSGGVPAGNVVDSQAPRLLPNQLRWDLTAEQIESMAAELTERTKLVYDRVGAQEQGEVSYENTLKALADVEVEYTGAYTSREVWRSENQCAVIKILLVVFFLLCTVIFFLPLAPSAAWWVFFPNINTYIWNGKASLKRGRCFGRRSSWVSKVISCFYMSRCINGSKLSRNSSA